MIVDHLATLSEFLLQQASATSFNLQGPAEIEYGFGWEPTVSFWFENRRVHCYFDFDGALTVEVSEIHPGLKIKRGEIETDSLVRHTVIKTAEQAWDIVDCFLRQRCDFDNLPKHNWIVDTLDHDKFIPHRPNGSNANNISSFVTVLQQAGEPWHPPQSPKSKPWLQRLSDWFRRPKKRLTQRAPDPRQRAPGPWWWDCRPWGRRARFQVVCVARSWFRQTSVLSSRPCCAIPRRGITPAVGQVVINHHIKGINFSAKDDENKAKSPKLIMLLASAILCVAFASLSFASSNSRDNQDSAKQKEMMMLVLEWGRLSPFPASATNVSIKTEGSSFTRSFRAGFIAPKQDIQAWIKDSPGLNETTPDKLSDNKVQYIMAPGGGANKAEVTIDYGLNQVEIYVSWG